MSIYRTSEQHLIVGGPRQRHFRRWQVRIVFQIQLRRPALDRAQQQMLHGIEGDGGKPQCLPDRGGHFGQRKRLQQPQHLHVFPPAAFAQPRFHLPPQLVKLFRQLPALKRRGLIQRIGLLLQQRQIVQRIENHFLPPVAPAVPRNHFAGATDHHFPYEGFHQHLPMPVFGRHRVIVGLIPHQRLRTDPGGSLVTGFIRRRRKRQ